jgi:hypothetical protein
VSASSVEAFLARIYVDAQARARFLSNPTVEALNAGLSPDEIEAVKQMDQVGLELFALSLERKRQRQCAERGRRNHFWRKRRA